jgi:predicted nucleic acid-binding protein
MTAVLQQQARQWWDQERGNYRLVTSQFVLDEAAVGDPDAARRRLEMLDGIPLLLPSERVEEIAEELIRRSLMPEKARLDALHVATAAVGGVHYLLTQNCKHIANAHVLPQVYDLLEELRLPRLLICTPAEFLGGAN